MATTADLIEAMSQPERRALEAALAAAIAAGAMIGPGFDCALIMDADGVTIVFTVPIGTGPNPVALIPSAMGNLPEEGAAPSGDLSPQTQED